LGNGVLKWFRSGGKNPKPPQLKDYISAEVPMNREIFGPDVFTKSIPATLVFEAGGMGDYINWCAALKYIETHYSHVDVRVFTSKLFIDVLKYLFEKNERWIVADKKDFLKYHVQGSVVRIPKRGTQLLNACGAHLMDLGFHYFLCLDGPLDKKHMVLPEINYEGPWKWPELDPQSDYCIFTPGSTTDVREMPVTAFNELLRYVKSKGITPVFLGKAELSDNYNAKFLNYDYGLGIDLRERTNLIEATQIIRKAKFIIGIDNGLLHMAGTTNTPIIFGHNITTVEHRNIRRNKGLTINITANDKELPCIGCQSKIRFVSNHDFRKCIFKENPDLNKKCLNVLFKNAAVTWKKAIDECLKDGQSYRNVAKNVTRLV